MEQLFRLHYLHMVRLAMQLVDDQASAEDVVQEVFAALAAGKPSPEEPLRYLRTAVVNRARSHLRWRSLRRSLRLDPAPDAEPASAQSLREADRARVLTLVARLPTRQREVVVLRYYEQLDNSEIAHVLGTTVGAVTSSQAKAMASLRRFLEAT
ncbi:MAG: sigma-70 family RNA polymerase sigma factor [Kineosporiaceae bacterium]